MLLGKVLLLPIYVHVLHFEPLNHTCADDGKLRPYLTVSLYELFPGTIVLTLLFVEYGRFLDTGLLQLEVLFYSINVLNIHMAIEYCKFLAMQSFVFQYRKSFICFYSLLFCKLLMYFVLGDGSNHSLLAWNEFRFSVKLFDVFVLQVIFEVLMFCFWGFEVLTAAAVVINSFFSL